MRISLKRLVNSFKDAIKGIAYVFRNEQNFKLQILAGILAVFFMFLFQIKIYEKLIVILMIFLILILELVNTVVEKFIDLLKPRMEIHAGVIKDIMAGAVFISSLSSLILAIIIFYPYIISLFERL